MKKYLYLFAATVLISCGTEQASENKNTAVSAADTAPAATGCAAMPIFRQGSVIENRTIDGSGRELAKSVNTIVSVREENGMTLSDMEVVIAGDSPIHALYKCDGKIFYIDMGTLMGKMKGATNVQRSEAWMALPLDMKLGDTLARQMISMNFDIGGMKVSLENKLSNSKVLSKEKVTTAAGSWDCFKIGTVMNIHSEMKGDQLPGKKTMVMDKQMRLVTCFNANTGVVKMEIYENDKISSISEVTAFR